MKITYSSTKVEKFFCNYNEMQKRIGYEWTRKIKKIVAALEAADTFQDYLVVGYAKPHPLTNTDGCYGLSVSGNVRLVVKPNLEENSIEICEEIEVKGVCDYHGDKENWFIP